MPQLAHVFNRCQWVIGSDTGPLHLGVACGARAIGWYFSRARVHETGPYGVGHYVWQHQKSAIFKNREAQGLGQEQESSLFMACHGNDSTYARGSGRWTFIGMGSVDQSS